MMCIQQQNMEQEQDRCVKKSRSRVACTRIFFNIIMTVILGGVLV